jgi:hypothetical protein
VCVVRFQDLALTDADTTSLQLQGIGGHYFEDGDEAPVVPPGAPETGTSRVMAYAVDAANAERLWELALDMLDVPS